MKLEVYFTPAEFERLRAQDLSGTACVVFDVLRATSTIVTALARDAESVLPVATIEEALQRRAADPEVLLAGERDGLRITAAVSGSLDFDLGNSPREFNSSLVRGRRIVTTTTNGSRALTACRGATHVFAGSFLNMAATAQQVLRSRADLVLLVCSGTGKGLAFEDVLGAGALCHQLLQLDSKIVLSDSAHVASELFAAHAGNLESALTKSTNARRLLDRPDLHDDVGFCLTENLFPIAVASDAQGRLYRVGM